MDSGRYTIPEKILRSSMFLALLEMRDKYPPTGKDDTIYWRVARCIFWILGKKEVPEETKVKLKSIVSDYESFGAKPWHFVHAVNHKPCSSALYTEEDYKKMAEIK
jgi:hypothetical protein